jgi:hypothetical protein
VDPPALRAGLPLPSGLYGALIYSEGSNDRLHWAAVGQHSHDRKHQPLRLVHALEGGGGALGEGATAPFTLVAAALCDYGSRCGPLLDGRRRGSVGCGTIFGAGSCKLSLPALTTSKGVAGTRM